MLCKQFIETTTQALHATERACPYNNFSNAYVLHGEVPDPRFGGDCMFQAKQFGDRIRAVLPSATVEFHNDSGGDTRGHIVAFVGDGDERQACELTSLATAPIILEECRGRAHPVTIPTFPRPPTGNRSLRAFWLQQMEQLNIFLDSPENSGQLWHRIATDAPIELPDEPHPVDDYMARLPRKTLVLQLLEPDFVKTTMKLDRATGITTIKRVDAAPVTSDRIGAFREESTRIAGVLGVTRTQLLDFFMDGVGFAEGAENDL